MISAGKQLRKISLQSGFDEPFTTEQARESLISLKFIKDLRKGTLARTINALQTLEAEGLAERVGTAKRIRNQKWRFKR